MDQPAGEVKGDERLADAGRGAKEREHATGDPGGPKPVDGREAVGHLLEGREWREGLFGWQQVDERMGQRLTVGEALGGLPDEREGIDVVLGAADAAVDGAPGLIEGGGGREGSGGHADEFVDDGAFLGLGVHGADLLCGIDRTYVLSIVPQLEGIGKVGGRLRHGCSKVRKKPGFFDRGATAYLAGQTMARLEIATEQAKTPVSRARQGTMQPP